MVFRRAHTHAAYRAVAIGANDAHQASKLGKLALRRHSRSDRLWLALDRLNYLDAESSRATLRTQVTDVANATSPRQDAGSKKVVNASRCAWCRSMAAW
jgi:hypothetical protein